MDKNYITSQIKLKNGSNKINFQMEWRFISKVCSNGDRKLWGYDEENDPLEQWIINLTLHEVGHTLALIHNFNASYLHGPREIHDVSITGNATLSSIMDYDPPNIAPEGVKQGRFFSIEPGEYDKWAIEFLKRYEKWFIFSNVIYLVY